MLRYFLEKSSIEQISDICKALNQTKRCIESGDFTNPYGEYYRCAKLFDNVQKIAVDTKDEQLANAQYVFKQYFLLFCNLMKYFELLKEKKYKESWDKLQDCIDGAQYIGGFADDQLDIPPLLDLLRNYETLYPYNVFLSGEYIEIRSHCSICGKSMQSLECSHITGNLYWGQPAIKEVDEIKAIQAICIVNHPEDKRCVVELSGDNREEAEKFKKVDLFLECSRPFLQNFTVKSVIEMRMKDIEMVGRNDKCPCGSGIKFKKCCGKDLYYKYERNIITLKEQVNLFYF